MKIISIHKQTFSRASDRRTMHISPSIHSIFIWSVIVNVLLSCKFCTSQTNSLHSVTNIQDGEEEAIAPLSPVDYSSPSLAIFSPFDSDAVPVAPSSSYTSYMVDSAVSSATSSSAHSSSSAPSTFSSNDFIAISPRSSSTSSSSRRRKSKYSNKSIKKSRYLDPGQTIDCHRREYTYLASNTDSKGRRCWQYITAMACWGRCETLEVMFLFNTTLLLSLFIASILIASLTRFFYSCNCLSLCLFHANSLYFV